MKTLMAVGCLVALSCASSASPVAPYEITMESQLPHVQNMALRFEGKAECFGKVAKGAPVQCEPVANVPRTVRVSWGDPSSWDTTGKRNHSVVVPLYGQAIPQWFRSGDAIVFAIDWQHRLSITFKCHRPGRACVSYPPYTRYGAPL